MSDRRLTPANTRVAAQSLKGQVRAAAFVDGVPARIVAPLVDLCPAPGAPRDRQLLQGAEVLVFERHRGQAFVQSKRDGYVGYIPEAAVREGVEGGPAPTHRVAVRATHAYPSADFKQHEVAALSFGAQVRVVDERPRFAEIEGGLFVPKRHLRPLDVPFRDPVTIAQLFFGTPYLWGGNSSAGIDCSGLVQAALWACDLPCPADSDQQRAALGARVEDRSFQRGDLLFWAGHVGLMVDEATLLHANAHHMAVAYEDVRAALARIEAQGDGALLRHARL